MNTSHNLDKELAGKCTGRWGGRNFERPNATTVYSCIHLQLLTRNSIDNSYPVKCRLISTSIVSSAWVEMRETGNRIYINYKNPLALLLFSSQSSHTFDFRLKARFSVHAINIV